MKKNLLGFVFICICFFSCISEETTTYYLIRHAEKERKDTTNRDPNLNKKGRERAVRWANYFKNIPLESIYTTDYKRTQQTATPTAKTKDITLKRNNPNTLYNSIFQLNTKGKSVLVVGHSNTTPAFANSILGEEKYQNMKDDDNATLFIVTIKGDLKTSTTVKVN
ncbi:phosphoglycerate mutase family protein [Polaribacter sp. HL-MS24]|uniref:SixA phosphatase family protein n=1 Tax=Polaribacter sp. HL-MS24 TaxID=3077735 RepID=UPI002934BA50|nr:phosphoglycerate mutase family protein [Polaribacter sp. HL-MS24]WOC40431.1 phosphoglycerate mutase family protein [Polaribacter sp. HL-MS24]